MLYPKTKEQELTHTSGETYQMFLLGTLDEVCFNCGKKKIECFLPFCDECFNLLQVNVRNDLLRLGDCVEAFKRGVNYLNRPKTVEKPN